MKNDNKSGMNSPDGNFHAHHVVYEAFHLALKEPFK